MVNKKKIQFKTDEFGSAKSSLMVLDYSSDFLSKKMEKHEGLPKYLRYLIKKFGSGIEKEYQFDFRNTKKYQTRGENYKRIKFEVDGNTWMAYQILAFYLRISISYLFAILLGLDARKSKIENNEKQIVTGYLKEIQLNLELFLEISDKFDYGCLLKLRL